QIGAAGRTKPSARFIAKHVTRQRENNFLSHQVIKFNSLAVEGRQVQVLFAQLVLLFVFPRDSRCKSLRELDVDRQLNRLQTAATSNGYFRAQLAAKLNFFSLAPDAALDT